MFVVVDLSGSIQDLLSLVVVHRFICSMACRTCVPALEGIFLTTGSPGKSPRRGLFKKKKKIYRETTRNRAVPLGPRLEGMATHSSILSWRIPWTEKPSRL